MSETLTGQLIWIDWPAILKMAVVYAVVGGIHIALRHRFLAVTFRPERATAVRLWDFFFYVTFGVVIAFSVEVAGVLMVFSALVIPAVIAFLYTHRFGAALGIAWVSGTVAIVGGIGTSFYLDLPTGPLLVVAFGVVLIVAAVVRPLFGAAPVGDIVVAELEPDRTD